MLKKTQDYYSCFCFFPLQDLREASKNIAEDVPRASPIPERASKMHPRSPPRDPKDSNLEPQSDPKSGKDGPKASQDQALQNGAEMVPQIYKINESCIFMKPEKTFKTIVGTMSF